MAGAVLAGQRDFIANARLWQRRMGGNLIQQTPFVASSMMRFEHRLGLLEACHQRALELAKGLGGLRGVRVHPAIPQTNMLHLHFELAAEAVNDARDAIAEVEKWWLLGSARPSDVPGWSYAELTVGDCLLKLDNTTVVQKFEQMLERARSTGAVVSK